MPQPVLASNEQLQPFETGDPVLGQEIARYLGTLELLSRRGCSGPVCELRTEDAIKLELHGGKKPG